MAIFGMPFALTVAHFKMVPWPQFATVALYSVALAWISVLAWRGQRHIFPVTTLDGLFIGFVVLVATELIFEGDWEEQFALYLPFLVVTPYHCGRLAEQIYSNYFMSVGTWLMLGMAASIRAHDTQAVSRG